MRHNQSWSSPQEKINVWLELCDLSLELMLAGLCLKTGNKKDAEKLLWQQFEDKRQKQLKINQDVFRRLQNI